MKDCVTFLKILKEQQILKEEASNLYIEKNFKDAISCTSEVNKYLNEPSADGAVYYKPINQSLTFVSTARNSMNFNRSPRGIISYTLSDDGHSIQSPWETMLNQFHRYLMNVNTGAMGTSDINNNYAGGTYNGQLALNTTAGGRGGGLTCSLGTVINDLILVTSGDFLRFFRADNGEFLGQIVASDVMWDESYLPDTTNPTTNVMSPGTSNSNGAQETSTMSQMLYNDKNLYVVSGGYGRAASSSYGRQLLNFKLIYNTPYNINLTSLFVATGSTTVSTNSQKVVFTSQDADS